MTTHQKPPGQEADSAVPKHYTPRELADLLGVSLPLLSFLRKTGRGPRYVKFGYRNILYSAVEVERYLKGRERLSTSDPASQKPAPQNDNLHPQKKGKPHATFS